MELTEAQKKTIETLKSRWDHVGDPYPLACDDCVMVEVSSNETGSKMLIGIETDGHPHS